MDALLNKVELSIFYKSAGLGRCSRTCFVVVLQTHTYLINTSLVSCSAENLFAKFWSTLYQVRIQNVYNVQ